MEILDYTNILTFSSTIYIDTVTPELVYRLLSLKKSSTVFIVASLLASFNLLCDYQSTSLQQDKDKDLTSKTCQNRKQPSTGADPSC